MVNSTLMLFNLRGITSLNQNEALVEILSPNGFKLNAKYSRSQLISRCYRIGINLSVFFSFLVFLLSISGTLFNLVN